MEVGPTMHYAMGGIRVDAESGAATVPGLFAAGEAAAGLHGSNRLGGNSLSDLLVFGRRAGEAAAEAAAPARADGAGTLPEDFLAESVLALDAPFGRTTGEDPNRLHEDLKETMQTLVGIFRTESDLVAALGRIERYKARWYALRVGGPRSFNPSWDLVHELGSMLTVSEAIARSALERTESRGAHSRLDHPGAVAEWDAVNVTVQRDGEAMAVRRTPTVGLPDDLRELVAVGSSERAASEE